MTPKICPCKDCKVHKSLCAAFCKAYKEWKAEHIAANRETNKAKYEYSALAGYVVNAKEKNLKRMKRRYK